MKRGTLNFILRISIGLVVAAYLANALSGLANKTIGTILSANLKLCLVTIIALVLYRVVNASGWTYVVRSLGGEMPLKKGVKIWLTSEAFRWLPGSVWGYFSRVHQANLAGLNGNKSTLSAPIEVIITLLAWAFTAFSSSILIFNSSSQVKLWQNYLSGYSSLKVELLIPVLCLTFILLSLVIFKNKELIVKKLKPLKKAALYMINEVSFKDIAKVFCLYTALCFLNGISFYLCCKALGFNEVSLFLAIAINAKSFLIGFIAIFAPGGLGVREGSISLMLAPLIGLQAGLTCALVWRTFQLVTEILCLIVTVLLNLDNAGFAKVKFRRKEFVNDKLVTGI